MKSLRFIFFIAAFAGICLSCSKSVDQDGLDNVISELKSEISADSIGYNIEWLESMGTRFCFADNHRDIAVNIMNRLKSYGIGTARLDSFYVEKLWRGTEYSMWEYNVVASIVGNENPDSIIVLGAHYDNVLREGDLFSVVPGANDNASGVAAMLEIARSIKETDYKPMSTLTFVAFAAEEIGLYGSTYMASELYSSGAKVKFMLNNDMIACQPADRNSGWFVNIINYPVSEDLLLQVRKVCDRYSILNDYTDNTYQNYSDSYPFAEYGFPAIFFESGALDPNYHTLNDISANCNYKYCAEIARLCASLIVKLDN
jgi:bacterial leucyl aminopeptidase